MARIDKRRAGGTRPHAPGVRTSTQRTAAQRPAPARSGQKRGGSIEDTMFFPRLRRHTKWMFVALALFFGLGFVLFGVGAGGTGLGDLFRNQHGGGGGSGTSVGSALKETQKHPNDATAWQTLATAYETKGDIDAAVDAQVRYTELAPKDVIGFETLAGLYRSQAIKRANEAQSAQLHIAYSGAVSPLGNGPTAGGRPLLADPFATLLTADASARYSQALQGEGTALQSSLATYQQIARLNPKDPNSQLAIANAARDAGDVPAQIAAYRRFLVLAPDDPKATLVRQQLRQLTKPAKATPKAKPAKPKSG